MAAGTSLPRSDVSLSHHFFQNRLHGMVLVEPSHRDVVSVLPGPHQPKRGVSNACPVKSLVITDDTDEERAAHATVPDIVGCPSAYPLIGCVKGRAKPNGDAAVALRKRVADCRDSQFARLGTPFVASHSIRQHHENVASVRIRAVPDDHFVGILLVRSCAGDLIARIDNLHRSVERGATGLAVDNRRLSFPFSVTIAVRWRDSLCSRGHRWPLARRWARPDDAVTVTLAEASPALAVTVATPNPCAIANPSPSTVTTSGAELIHSTSRLSIA